MDDYRGADFEMPKSLTFLLPLREGFMAKFLLPIDLTFEEIDRINQFLKTIPLEKQEQALAGEK